MDDMGVIDHFTATFVAYIDSGFGLLSGNVASLTAILIALDITLAGLFWALSETSDVIAKLIKKVLYVGVFALILGNFSGLAQIVFDSFAGLGLAATNTGLTAADLLRPGHVAATGYAAAHPLLEEAGKLLGFTTFFNNVVTVLVFVFAWAIVVLAFFVLAIQLFVTIVEFKLTTLAGFVLVPFAFWNKTAFLAEKVLGNVVASGVKVMVLAIILGIGTTIFVDLAQLLQDREVTLQLAMSLVLSALALFGLGIFGPGIAAGLISGGPQLGAGSVAGTVGGAAAAALGTADLAVGAARTMGGSGLAAVRAGSQMGAAARDTYRTASEAARAAGGNPMAAGLSAVAKRGAQAVGARIMGKSGSPAEAPASEPAWARDLKARSHGGVRPHAEALTRILKDGDRPSPAPAPTLATRDTSDV
ncbi:MAG: P-type conjugative transfer protein TrbL [Sphingomonadales bacterium]|nr:P-type conjugative transfer protein TrbL [Sphingomonadales bacterium]